MIKHSKKKFSLIFAAALALILAVPAAAQAESAGPTNAPEISSDSGERYMSVAEAAEQFGYDPNESTESTEPEISPYTSWWGCDYEGRGSRPAEWWSFSTPCRSVV